MRTLTAKPRSDACQRGSANAQSNGKPLPVARTGGGDATHSRPHALGDTLQPTTTRRPMTNRAPPLRQESTTKPHPAARARRYAATDNHAQADDKPCPTSQARIYDKTAPGRTHSAQRRSANRSTSPLPARKTHLRGIGAHNDQAPGFPTKKRDALMTSTSRFPFPDPRTPRLPAFRTPGPQNPQAANREPRATSEAVGSAPFAKAPSAIGSDQK